MAALVPCKGAFQPPDKPSNPTRTWRETLNGRSPGKFRAAAAYYIADRLLWLRLKNTRQTAPALQRLPARAGR